MILKPDYSAYAAQQAVDGALQAYLFNQPEGRSVQFSPRNVLKRVVALYRARRLDAGYCLK
jgi:glutamine synthetase